MTPMSIDSSPRGLSSTPDNKRGNFSTQVGQILPANRSTLTPFKTRSLISNSSSDLICKEKNSLMLQRKNMRSQAYEIIDLSDHSILDEQPRKGELIAPFSARKRKLLSTENVATQQNEFSHGHLSNEKKFEINGPSFCISSGELEKSQIPHSLSSQKAQSGTSLLHKDDETGQRREVEFLSQNDGVKSIPVPSGNEETRGSDFLIQVMCFQNAMQIIFF